eukprot:3461603-Amphidinium_carterae.1
MLHTLCRSQHAAAQESQQPHVSHRTASNLSGMLKESHRTASNNSSGILKEPRVLRHVDSQTNPFRTPKPQRIKKGSKLG